jgi:ABC-type enterochelin transport system ATPase subunit
MKKLLFLLVLTGCQTQFKTVAVPNHDWQFVVLQEPIANLKVMYVNKDGTSKLGFLNAPVGATTVVGTLPK